MDYLSFSKMHGAGNDFVMINAIDQAVSLSAAQIRFLADRQFGVGCDQLLLVEQATVPEADFRYRIFNADGSEVAQCGNGARCFVRFVRDKQLTDKDTITVETHSGLIYPTLMNAVGDVQVDMGAPIFEAARIPVMAEQKNEHYVADVEEVGQVSFDALSMGNPHAILRVDDVATAPVDTLGAALESHAIFPERINVGFMEVVNTSTIKLRVFERGAGETLACGTGACAAVVSGIRHGWLSSPVSVKLPGGTLSISWAGEGEPVLMTGPTAHVFDGEIAWSTLQKIQ